MPSIAPRFPSAYPGIRLEVIAEESFFDVLAVGCDAGIRCEKRVKQNMAAVPIEPRRQCMAAAAAPAYLSQHGSPEHPREYSGTVVWEDELSTEPWLNGCPKPGVRHSGSIPVSPYWYRSAERQVMPSVPRLVASVSSTCSRIGCGSTSCAPNLSLYSNRGGQVSALLTFTTLDQR